MSHLSQNLERLIQMMSIEQLIGLLKQTNNINSTNNNDILLSPIVQKVIQEYEQEIKELKANVSQSTNVELPIVKDYSDDIAQGSYVGFIQQLGDFEYETAWAPDYADHSKTIKSLNNDFIREEF